MKMLFGHPEKRDAATIRNTVGEILDKKEDMEYERIQVECRSGHEANAYPVAFTFQGQRWEVLEIVDRWHEGGINSERPAIHYFKVKTSQDRAFMLMYIVHLDEWCVLV